MNINKKNKIYLISLIIITLIVLFIFDFLDILIFDDQITNEMICNAIPRLFALILIIYLIKVLELSEFKLTIDKFTITNFVFIIIGLLVAINNFPFVSLIDKSANIISSSSKYIFPLLIEAVVVAVFEELLYRVLLFGTIIKSIPKRKKYIVIAIIVTNLLFSIIHVVSTLSIGNIIVQLGYTFLLGMMLTVIIYKTKNVFLCIIIHFIYNFGGRSIDLIVSRSSISPALIIVTTIIALVAFLYYLFGLNKTLNNELSIDNSNRNEINK